MVTYDDFFPKKYEVEYKDLSKRLVKIIELIKEIRIKHYSQEEFKDIVNAILKETFKETDHNVY